MTGNTERHLDLYRVHHVDEFKALNRFMDNTFSWELAG